MFFISDWYILPAVFLLDFLLGDPLWLPHPVRWMGKGIAHFELLFRDKIPSPRWSGLFFALFLVSMTWLFSILLLAMARSLDPLFGKLVEILLIYYAVAAFSLKNSAMDVYLALKNNGLEAAKEKVSRIVGRDVESLDREGVVRATVETVGENLVDGVISPLFWAAVGGAPLAMTYRMINTLDSMVGYKNEKYRDFGMASARIDDLANWIPARLSVPVIALAAFFAKLPWKQAFETGFAEGKNHASPNSGYPEAAFAGALGVRLGGYSYYGRVLVEKPWIGQAFGAVVDDDVKRACRLLLIASLMAIFMAMGIAHAMSMV